MEEQERYFVKKILKDCLFPETLCEIKDTKSKLYILLEDKDTAIIIKNLLNQQDKEIKQLKEENMKLKKIMGVMKNKTIEELQECRCDNCNLSLLYPVKDSEFVNDLKNDNDSLCEENQKLIDNLDKLIYENQQLKEENGYIIFSDGYDENGNEVHKQEFVKYKDKFKKLFEENQQLKQTQKQLAIEKLEQILNYMENSNNNHYPLPYEIKNFIDNQIKNLN